MLEAIQNFRQVGYYGEEQTEKLLEYGDWRVFILTSHCFGGPFCRYALMWLLCLFCYSSLFLNCGGDNLIRLCARLSNKHVVLPWEPGLKRNYFSVSLCAAAYITYPATLLRSPHLLIRFEESWTEACTVCHTVAIAKPSPSASQLWKAAINSCLSRRLILNLTSSVSPGHSAIVWGRPWHRHPWTPSLPYLAPFKKMGLLFILICLGWLLCPCVDR